MNKINQMLKGIMLALPASLMAGSGAMVLLCALKSPVNPNWLYACAAVAALLGLFATTSLPAALISAAATAGGFVLIALKKHSIDEIRLWLQAANANLHGKGEVIENALLPGCLIAFLAALLLLVLLLRRRSSLVAFLLYLLTLIVCYAMVPTMTLRYAVPGLVAAVVAFSRCCTPQTEMTGGGRALVPAVLAVSIAMLFVPQAGLSWKPLEDAAQTVRRFFQDYFLFTDERVPYTLYRDGYDHLGQRGDLAVVELGGPADPDEEPRLQVTTDADLLLRGSVYRNYTGHGWEDSAAKRRFPYYDLIHRNDRLFLWGSSKNEAFEAATAEITYLRDGCSALFIPTRTSSIDTVGDLAVYYNSIGEAFFSHEAREGDAYAFSGWRTPDRKTKREAVNAHAGDKDNNLKTIRRENLRLPAGIEENLYLLTRQIVESCTTEFDRVVALEDWLATNCTYRLDTDMPDPERDFVSEFALDRREGYCSYFASALTVMCRIAGVPARYVEGYSVHAFGSENTLTLSGRDAHAWTEVYFNGIGWLPFDPASSTGGYRDMFDLPDAEPEEDSGEGDRDAAPTAPPTPTPTPEPTPEPTPDPNDTPGPDDTPTPEPNDTATPEPSQAPTPSPAPSNTPAPQADSEAPTPTPQPDSEPPSATPTPRAKAAAREPEDDRRDTLLKGILIAVAALLLLLLLLAAWVALRLTRTDALKLSRRKKDPVLAAMILYRAMLTLLQHMGQSPMNGETPYSFARRVSEQFTNPQYAAFTEGVMAATYGNKPLDEALLATGREAYGKLFAAMKPAERRRFAKTRALHGLGRFDVIP